MTGPSLTIDTASEPGSYARLLAGPPYRQIADDTWTNGYTAEPGGSRLGDSTTERPAISFSGFHDAGIADV